MKSQRKAREIIVELHGLTGSLEVSTQTCSPQKGFPPQAFGAWSCKPGSSHSLGHRVEAEMRHLLVERLPEEPRSQDREVGRAGGPLGEGTETQAGRSPGKTLVTADNSLACSGLGLLQGPVSLEGGRSAEPVKCGHSHPSDLPTFSVKKRTAGKGRWICGGRGACCTARSLWSTLNLRDPRLGHMRPQGDGQVCHALLGPHCDPHPRHYLKKPGLVWKGAQGLRAFDVLSRGPKVRGPDTLIRHPQSPRTPAPRDLF